MRTIFSHFNCIIAVKYPATFFGTVFFAGACGMLPIHLSLEQVYFEKGQGHEEVLLAFAPGC